MASLHDQQVNHPLRRAALVAALCAPLLTACGKGDTEAVRTELTARIAEVERVSAEKDRLLADFVENTRFMNAINAELDRVRKLKPGVKVIQLQPGESPIAVAAYRDSVLAHIRQLTARLDSTEARLAASARARAGAPAAGSAEPATATSASSGSAMDDLQKQLASYRATIAEVRAQLEAQQSELTSLQDENNSLRAERARLAGEKAALDEKLADLAEAENTVYYIAGSKAQLQELGIVREEGGARGLLLAKKGKTLVPGRDLHPDDFTALSKTGNTELSMPKAGKAYTIVSQHNPSYLSPTEKDGALKGTVRITNAAAFWAPSRFLILVER
ncbi:hypothetical protein [Gemmatimonas sp.]|uniref:hypothetical protein n=1 Tax=Gemmatimonas sp. TaxID=1962908 RepID=UPI0033410EB2